MDWVETRGRTIEEAKDRALDQLGVSATDADFEILEEPRSGLFGLRKTEARVRARVRPKAPRPKAERRGRTSRERTGEKTERPAGEARADAGGTAAATGGSAARQRSRRRGSGDTDRSAGDTAPARPERPAPRQSHGTSDKTERDNNDKNETATTDGPARTRTKENTMTDSETAVFAAEEQAAVVCKFLDGVVGAFGLEGTSSAHLEDGILHASVDGSSLGLLIGPRGGTLRALQELAWTTLQREAGGRSSATVRLDVAGFVQRRRAALESFARAQAAEVRESGLARSLEPMSAADRKVVHDALVDEAAVSTASEGEDPNRRVVILPASND